MPNSLKERLLEIIDKCYCWKMEPIEDKKCTGERKNFTLDKDKLATAILAELESGIELDLRKFVQENDLIRKFRYSRLEFYVDKDDTWDRQKYDNDPKFRAEIDTKVAYEIAMFIPILDFINNAISTTKGIIKFKGGGG